jgi:hypothetical protein
MGLLTAHKILIAFALLLSMILVVWGVLHGVYRHEPGGYWMLFLGTVTWPFVAMYLVKLWRNPPLH